MSATSIQAVLTAAVADYPGAVALIRADGRSEFHAAGVADIVSGRERRPTDEFRVGSITKTFTALLVLQLAAERELSLDDTVERWLPGLLPEGLRPTDVTIRRLVGQTSGIFPYTSDPQLMENYFTAALPDHLDDTYTPEQLVAIATSHPAEFPVGERFGYSNTNFVLAAMILEKAGGMSFADLIEYRIARPLKLKHTYSPGTDRFYRGEGARLYSKLNSPDLDARLHDVTERNASDGFGAGSVVSTAEDLAVLLSALLSGRFLAPKQTAEMFAMTPVPDGVWLDGYRYGLGISSFTLPDGTELFGHGGLISGSFTYLFGTRDGRRVAVVNVNGDWGMPPLELFPELLAEVFAEA
ncbi:serine hydrolase domain-containing protein [Catenulispora pinisilvae]|uniref:serine hydrolase domain-containing protein n=1 Tax=Catenulispora pinisilvae TaxID=2705253 RepID=UPI0018923E13|nr:serine hydrolase domain-containing protein [Catenulispora pinisilvae]